MQNDITVDIWAINRERRHRIRQRLRKRWRKREPDPIAIGFPKSG
jgi:RNase H-fold protein (predicted Holliday junction resolvase)